MRGMYEQIPYRKGRVASKLHTPAHLTMPLRVNRPNMKHRLIFEDVMRAKCSCGEWAYIGLTAEANASIKKVYRYHTELQTLPRKVARKVKSKKKG